jgi:hypothetical protein
MTPLHDKVFTDTERKCGDDGWLCVRLMGITKDNVEYKNHAFVLTVHNLEFGSIQKGVQQYMPGAMQTQKNVKTSLLMTVPLLMRSHVL